MSGVLLFGKLPAHGDFVWRGFDPAERARLDHWFSASLDEVRALLGAGFEDAYDRAPPWRFLWAEPKGWVGGALAASADRIGRRFPLLLGRRCGDAREAEAAAEACEGAIYEAVAGAWAAQSLVDHAAALAPVATEPSFESDTWWVDGGREAGIPPLPGRHPQGLILAMLTVAQGETA